MNFSGLDLVALRGDEELGRWSLAPGTYTVGRAGECSIPLAADGLAEEHAMLLVDESLGVWIEAAEHGVAVSGTIQRVAVRITPEQPVALGEVTLLLHANGVPEPAAEENGESLPEEFQEGDRYEVGGEIAKGGMGAILQARQVAARRTVAMKVILGEAEEDPSQRFRFIEEAQITSQLEHPNIVPVHDLGIDARGRLYYTMKLVQGTNLKKVLSRLAKEVAETVAEYPLVLLLTIFQKVCDAVGFAHSRGVIHRDLKPENIMIGEFGEVLVMDWGLAKVMGAEDNRAPLSSARREQVLQQTLEGAVMGTPQYMSPEQARGEVQRLDARSDVFALGCILYEMLTLEKAFPGESVAEVLTKIRTGTVRTPATVTRGKAAPRHWPRGVLPASLEAITMKALRLDPAERYATVRAMQQDISAYQNGFATAAEQPGFYRQLTLLIGRHKEKFVSAAAALLLLLASAAAFLVRLESERNRAVRNEQKALEAEQLAKTEAQNARLARTEAEEQQAKAQEALTKMLAAVEAEKTASAKADTASLAATEARSALQVMEASTRDGRMRAGMKAASQAIDDGDLSLALLHYVYALEKQLPDSADDRQLRFGIAMLLQAHPTRLRDLPIDMPAERRALSISPHGIYLAAEEKRGVLTLRESASGRMIATLPISGEPPMGWDVSGQFLSLGGAKPEIREAATGRVVPPVTLVQPPAPTMPPGAQNFSKAPGVNFLPYTVSSNGLWVLGLPEGRPTTAMLYQPENLQAAAFQVQNSYEAPIRAASFNPDGKAIAIAAGQDVFWRMLHGGFDSRWETRLTQTAGFPKILALSTPGDWLAAIGYPQQPPSAKPLDAAALAKLRGMEGPWIRPSYSEFSSDVWLWRTPMPQLTPKSETRKGLILRHPWRVPNMALSSDSPYLLAGPRLWRLGPPPFQPAGLQLPPEGQWKATRFIFSSDRTALAARWSAAGQAQSYLAAWDAATGKLLGPAVTESSAADVVMIFSHDHRVLFTADAQGVVRAYEVARGRLLRSTTLPTGRTDKPRLYLRPQGQRMLAAWPNGFQIFDTATGAPVKGYLPVPRVGEYDAFLGYEPSGNVIAMEMKASLVNRGWDGLTGEPVKLSTKARRDDPDPVTGLKTDKWADATVDGVKCRLFEGSDLRVDDRLIAPHFLTFPASGRLTEAVLVDNGRQLYRFSEGGGLVQFDLRPDPRPVAELRDLAEKLSNQKLTPDGKEVKDRASLLR